MGILDFLLRRKKIDEAAHRAHLLRTGRITEGAIFDIITDDAGAITQIFFRYNISGVDYESSQLLDQEQSSRQDDYTPGALITVRYHPHQPGNSTVV